MWKSEEEINKAYAEHLESLRVSGVEFDEDSVEAERAKAVMSLWLEQGEPF